MTGESTDLKTRVRGQWSRFRRFIHRDLWTQLPRERGPRLSYRLLRMGVLIVEGFVKSEVFLLAAALTYQVVFALVPLLVVMLAIVKAVGGFSSLGDQVQKLIVEYITPQAKGDIAGKINEFIGAVNTATIGVVGFIALLYTSLSLLSTVEKVFNRLWGIKTPRTLLRRFTVYWTFLTVSPILLAASLSMTTFVKSDHLYVWLTEHIPFFGRGVLLLTPFLMAWLLFTGFYIFMPNTRVHPGAAAIGGVVAGTAWEGMKGVYFWYNAKIGTAYAFYAAVGAIPVFLLWIYLSWIIVLFGAEVVFAVQHVNTYKREIDEVRLSAADRDRFSLVIATEVVRAFVTGEPPPSGEEVAQRLNAAVRAVNEVLFELSSQGILRQVSLPNRKEPGFLPAKDPAVTTARDVLAAVRSFGDPATLPEGEPAVSIYRLVDLAENQATPALAAVTLRELALRPHAPPPGPLPAGSGNGDARTAPPPTTPAPERPDA